MTLPRRTAALIAVLGLLASLAVATPVQAAPTRVRVMTFNICGNVCRGGEVKRTAGNVAYQATARRVTVLFLQELCYSQFLAIRSRLYGHGYRGVFAAGETGGKCNDHDRRHGKAFGNAILVKGKVYGRITHGLPSAAAIRPEGRTMLGTSARIRGRSVYLVTTHTAPGGPNLAAQLRALRRYLEPIARRQPVIVGGDLNTLPEGPGLDAFYSRRVPGGHGVFREMDETTRRPYCRCGSPTFQPVPRKIDYVFASQRHFRPRNAATVGSRYSDHRMYLGEFILA
ncbi:MAG TPA: endonuclease/exonuclease/phosphatase family protein [Actinoplanes sp.]|nr:endonuclease/exonuclease/phosphatase family protein [Actinoplanes sp.]